MLLYTFVLIQVMCFYQKHLKHYSQYMLYYSGETFHIVLLLYLNRLNAGLTYMGWTKKYPSYKQMNLKSVHKIFLLILPRK